MLVTTLSNDDIAYVWKAKTQGFLSILSNIFKDGGKQGKNNKSGGKYRK